MDNEKLGQLAHVIAQGVVTPYDIVSPLTDQELMDVVHQRGFVGEFATGFAVRKAQEDDKTATFNIPEVDPDIARRLEALNPDYREVVRTRYVQKNVAVDSYIERGILSEEYRLPPLGKLLDSIEAVAPAYDAINNATGGNVGFDFMPRHLSDEQKHKLATGHVLPNWQMAGGALDYDAHLHVTDPTGYIENKSPSKWGLAVMDVSETPLIRGISADGSSAADGVNLRQVISKLATFREAIGLPKLSVKSEFSANELLICQVSPDKDTMFGIQLGRLERGEWPLDYNGTWTIGKQKVRVINGVYSVFSYYDTGINKLYTRGSYSKKPYNENVIRLSSLG